MIRTIKTEKEMIALGEELGKTLSSGSTIELIGDVGAGKTTLVKGIAKALGVTEPITSPSFTLSKTYRTHTGERDYSLLSHYDFYRLPDPGIMAEDLSESISDPNTITIVEWAETVESVLPASRLTVRITYNDDNTRTAQATANKKPR